MLRTTTALTIMRAGNKDNVLPGRAEAAVNFRILPGDTLASTEAHLRKQLANDDIKIKPYPGNAEPSPVSPTDSTGYRAIQQAVRQTFPDAVVAPGLMTAATDSRHFSLVSDAVFRFSPFRAEGRGPGAHPRQQRTPGHLELRRDDRLLSPAPEQHQRCSGAMTTTSFPFHLQRTSP
jgi:acetylornithine deacetylase/succinyl-diaminopimelate desuccinylase-like protein